MNKYIDPIIYGLPAKIQLNKINKDHIAIIKKRKSRIIMSDGKIILDQVNKIRKKHPELNISLTISGPICSKTVSLLKNNNISIIKQQ